MRDVELMIDDHSKSCPLNLPHHASNRE
jgi:hypothetical protein